jgi:D-glycero-alpha-D-manno-heptose 1-phosphate guanylyltransferase
MKGIRRVVLSVGHLHHTISGWFGQSWSGLDIVYAVESQPLGTGGATKLSMKWCTSEAVLVVNGDTFLDLDLHGAFEAWRKARAPVLIAREVQDTSRFGRLEVMGSRLLRFAEKGVPGRGLINAGAYVLPVNFLDSKSEGDSFSLERDVLVPMAGRDTIEVHVCNGIFIDIGIPDDYEQAQTLLRPFAIAS